jgi:NADP-dependent 3-hydroxy acid dehydrogenase YdfG
LHAIGQQIFADRRRTVTRIVLIAGAAGNLGRAVAAAFRDQGVFLILLDRKL